MTVPRQDYPVTGYLDNPMVYSEIGRILARNLDYKVAFYTIKSGGDCRTGTGLSSYRIIGQFDRLF